MNRLPVPNLILRHFLAIVAALLLVQSPAAGEPRVPEPLIAESLGRVVEIVDGDSLVLEDERRVRLVGLQAPKLPLGRPNFEPWPLSDEAKAAIADLTLGEEVILAHGGRREDRHGRRLAHLFLEDGTWVQEEMLRRGLARVYSFADNRALVDHLLRVEREARADRRGIWSDPFYAVRTPAQLHDEIGTFQIVEGRVLNVNEVRGRVFIDLEEDWRDGFSLSLAPAVRRDFESGGIDVDSYEGKLVRVRGWVSSYNGPRMEPAHPEQIEVFE